MSMRALAWVGLILLTLSGCDLVTGLEGKRPIMVDHPDFAAICLDSILPVPDGSSCVIPAIIIITIPNPNPGGA